MPDETPPPARRRVVAFERDDEGHWFARLDCGHTRHFRHDPPWQNHPWVVTEQGRAAFLNRVIDCVECA